MEAFLPGELVTNHLNINLFTHLEPKVANEVFVDPWLELTHPVFDRLMLTIDFLGIVGLRRYHNIPESGLAVTTLLRCSSRGLTRSASERGGRRISLAGHIGVGRGRSTGRCSAVLLVLVFVVLERHVDNR